MKVKRNNLTDELMEYQESQTTPSRKAPPPIVINYDQIIEKQSQVIESLYKQCTALRQKINRLKSKELFASQSKSKPQNNMQKFAQMVENGLLKEIGTLLEIQENQISRCKVMQAIKRLKWERQKKSEPIFIQSRKQVRVPVPVEIFVQKPVQKIVFQEKIVIQQKIVQVPVFREKIVERFVSKIQESENLLSTVSKLSSEQLKHSSFSGLQNSDDNLFLGTQSVLKQQSKQKPAKQPIRKNSTQIDQKAEIYRPQKKDYSNLAMNKRLTLSNIRQDQPNTNKTQFYNNNPSNKTQFNSKGSKYNVKSPKYANNQYKESYSKYDYNEEQDYTYQHGNDYQDKNQRYQKTTYRVSNDNNRTVASPKNNYRQKYKDEGDRYAFDKNKFLDSNKINPNNNYSRNIKRRDKYDFYEPTTNK